jgi:predicted ester cyclase
MAIDQATNTKALETHVCEAMNIGDEEVSSRTIDQLVAPDAHIRTPLPIEATGAQELKEVFATLHRAFPDLHMTVEDVIAEADKVVVRNTVTGTHQGEYLSLAPTGRSSTYNETFILRVADGRIGET